jgi:hypothetical protein
MRKKAWIVVSVALCLVGSLAVIVGSCHYDYPIEGHHGGNRDNPPDIKMTVGERRVAVRASWALRAAVRWEITWRVGIPSMESSDESVVKVHQPNKEIIILEARNPGRSLLKYHPCPTDPNRGFWVVVEEDPNKWGAGDSSSGPPRTR